MGHVCGGRKTDRLEIKAVDALWKLSSLRGVTASDLQPSRTALAQDIFDDSRQRCASTLISWIFWRVVPYSRFITYEFSKMTVRRRIPIDRTNR
jgi:hypothetical protein